MALKRGPKVNPNFSMSYIKEMIFILMVFFMVTSTLVAPNALKLLLPRSDSQTPAKAITTVSITEDLHFYIEQTPIPFQDLEAMLAQRLQGQIEPTISLHVHRTVPMEEVVKVMNIAKDNHYKLILATQPLK